MVVDTSVVFKWLRDGDEPYRSNALNILKQQQEDKIKITVPDFLYIEIANILATKTSINEKEIILALQVLYSLDLSVHKIEEDEIRDAAILARKYKSTVYDMLFVVVAKKLKTDLITADSKFVKRIRLPYVKQLFDQT